MFVKKNNFQNPTRSVYCIRVPKLFYIPIVDSAHLILLCIFL